VILATLAVGAYFLIGLVAGTLVLRRKNMAAEDGGSDGPVTVIVAARDEEHHLPDCLKALSAQAVDTEVEFIIVDDDSTDRTRQIVDEFSALDPRFRCISANDVPLMPPGKARAIHAGVSVARHDLIAITDADCRPPGGWLRAVTRRFADQSLGVLGGATEVRRTGVLAAIQAFDWMLLLGVASGWSLAGRPLTAMGNNMAFRREAYLDVGGYPGVPESVTEDYALFEAISRSTSWQARLDPALDLRNETEPVESIAAMFSQRRRWARGALAASPVAVLFYAIVLGAHALPLFILPTAMGAATMLILAKVAIDVFVAASMMGRKNVGLLASAFLPHQLWLFSYVLALPFVLAFHPDIRWKGRTHRTQPSSATGL
jgi:1,2-diacylglycerol 3-beta-glucosyltransferase